MGILLPKGEEMNELVVINRKETQGNHKVIARDLHKALESKQDYSRWIQMRVETYGFIEGYDFVVTRLRNAGRKNAEATEHLFTVEASKHLCMVERTEKGKQVRQYFIDVETKMKERGEWNAARIEGKSVRRILTNIISQYIDYAFSQGSRNADKYFLIYTKLLNSELFIIEEKSPNHRDKMNITQLHQVSVGEQILIKIISEGMRSKKFYKDIYQDAKEKLKTLSSVVGKSKLGQSEKQTLMLEFPA